MTERIKLTYEKFKSIVFIPLVLLILSFVGALMNMSAIWKNKCRMPVYSIIYPYGEDLTHFNFNNFSNVRLPYLTDIFPFFHYKYSLGDLVIFLSLFGLILFLIVKLWMEEY